MRRPIVLAVLAVVAVVAVGAAVGWYLASPLILRNSLAEAPLPTGTTVVASGDVAGADTFHFGRGRATIVETAPGRHALRFDEFSVHNGPDLYVYVSPTVGWDPAAVELGRLKTTDGSFSYDLPAGTDPADFRSAVVWCKAFTTPFATAPLSSP